MTQTVVPTEKRAGFYTAEDLLSLPSDARYELIRGELIDMPPPPGGEHGSRTMSLTAFVSVYVISHGLGECFAAETGFKIAADPDTVMAPDWAFVSNGRIPTPTPKGYWPVAPDIVLETRSPSDSRREIALKIEQWLRAGVKVVWDLDPAAKLLAVHRLGSTTEMLGPEDTLRCEDVLPGFEIPLAVVFK
jgi:Uma2 family endonuclease